jgi:hypothetical protein
MALAGGGVDCSSDDDDRRMILSAAAFFHPPTAVVAFSHFDDDDESIVRSGSTQRRCPPKKVQQSARLISRFSRFSSSMSGTVLLPLVEDPILVSRPAAGLAGGVERSLLVERGTVPEPEDDDNKQ